MNLNDAYTEKSKKAFTKSKTIIGPNKASKYVISKLHGATEKDKDSPGNRRKYQSFIVRNILARI